MSEMVERVAKAKWARRQEVARNAGIWPELANWDEETEALREEVRAETRAGIAAMRLTEKDWPENIRYSDDIDVFNDTIGMVLK